MKTATLHRETFKTGSKTYYNSSLFFPENVRRDVFILYGFVRVADNLVDSTPQDADGFYRFKNLYTHARSGKFVGDPIIDTFVDLIKRKEFDPAWVDAFLYSMELDLTKKTYDSLEETLEYIYGSAEVIGLFMARLLNLPMESYRYAEMQGRSMQYINFIRDIAEDETLGRRYIPLHGTSLQTLGQTEAEDNPEEFARFIRGQIDLYMKWQHEAEKGYALIPKRYRIPIKTASDMYTWTARQIERNPSVIFQRQVKPPKPRIIAQVLSNTLMG